METLKPEHVRTAEDHLTDVYLQYHSLLCRVAMAKFRVPESDVESLVHDVFVSYLRSSAEITDTRAWMVAAICNASRYFWRQRAKSDPLDDDIAAGLETTRRVTTDEIVRNLTVAEMLSYLQEQCRETIRLHYYEGHSAREIASLLSTTEGYAEKLIHKCLKRAREIYYKLQRGDHGSSF